MKSLVDLGRNNILSTDILNQKSVLGRVNRKPMSVTGDVDVVMQLRSVEYARRWFFVHKRGVFNRIYGATNVSLLICKYLGADTPFGHVTMIVHVLCGFI